MRGKEQPWQAAVRLNWEEGEGGCAPARGGLSDRLGWECLHYGTELRKNSK